MTDTLRNLQLLGHWFRAARHGIVPSAEKVHVGSRVHLGPGDQR